MFRAHCQLTALVKFVDAGDVILAHRSGASKGQVGVCPRDDGRLPVSGEGVTEGGRTNTTVLV